MDDEDFVWRIKKIGGVYLDDEVLWSRVCLHPVHESFINEAKRIAAKYGGTVIVDLFSDDGPTIIFDVPSEHDVCCSKEIAELSKKYDFDKVEFP